ncbi:unnamed protein product [Knipowitschia caucasica]
MMFYSLGVCAWRYRIAGLVITLGITFLVILMGSHSLESSLKIQEKQRSDQRRSPPKGLALNLLQTRTRSPPLVFLKTHRTGASTVQNLLFRMGEKDMATFAFPRQGFHFSYPNKFQIEFVDELPSGSEYFDILSSSLRFDVSQLKTLMPSDPVFITILRDPVHTFESIFAYYSSSIPAFTTAKLTSTNKTALSAFLDSPEMFWDPNIPKNGLAKNPMTFDLGLNNHVWNSSWPADLAFLEENFNLVMIAEYFDESLILLGALLNLELEELAYVRLNCRAVKDIHPLHKETKSKIKVWNNLDVLLYEYFKQIFLEKAKQYGWQRLQKEVKMLRLSTERIREKCLARRAVAPEELEDLVRPWQTNSLTILGYEVHANLTKQEQGFCLRLVLPEHQYHAHLYYQLYGREIKAG